MSSVLQTFVQQYVQPERQERYLALLSSAKRREDGLWDLLHDGRHLQRWQFRAVDGLGQNEVADLLQSKASEEDGWLFAAGDERDGRQVPLQWALMQYFGRSRDVLLFFANASMGYYENHEGERYVFGASLTKGVRHGK